MIEPNSPSQPLQAKFEAFQALHPMRESQARKDRVRDLEREVKSGEVHISSDQMRQYLASDHELARILAYLLIENGKVYSDQGIWRANVLSEWELLRRHELSPNASRMALYYAVRAYLTRLRGAPDLKAAVGGDHALIREIESTLSKSEIDCNSQLRDRIAELLSLLESGDSSSANPTIVAALISRRGAILSAVIVAVAAIVVGFMPYWEKISHPSKATPAQKTRDEQVPAKQVATGPHPEIMVRHLDSHKEEATKAEPGARPETQPQNSRAFNITLGEIVEVTGVQPTELADNHVSPDTAMRGVPVPWSFSIVVKSGGETRRYGPTLHYDVFQRKLVRGSGQGKPSTILSIPIRGSESVEVAIVGWADQNPDTGATGSRVLTVGGTNPPIKVGGRIGSKEFALFFALDLKEAASQ